MAGSNSLKKGMAYVLAANIINMVFSIITNFALPKFLSVETYATIKTFQLYVSYAGVLHLGYVDGMYLKYGGKEIGSIDKDKLGLNLSTLRCFQLLLTVTLAVGGAVARDWVFLAFALTLLPFNTATYFKYLFQAVGEFDRYGKITNVTSIVTFAVNMLLLFVVRTDEGMWYLLLYVLVDVGIWLALEIYAAKKHLVAGSPVTFSLQELIQNVRSGILLMLGNFSSLVLTSMDRWFVKALLDTVAFAQYSFAVSMEGMMNVAITPVTITLYNYFCKETRTEMIVRVRNYVSIFAVFLVSCAFPAKFILEVFLTKYMDSAGVLFFLFGSQIFYVVIKSIYVNLYKVRRKQKLYFLKLIAVIVAGFILNVVCFAIVQRKEAFAFGTFLSAVFWMLLCQSDFKDVKMGIKDVLFLAGEAAAFLLLGYSLNAIAGFVIYLAISLLMSLLCYRKEVSLLWGQCMRFLKKRS